MTEEKTPNQMIIGYRVGEKLTMSVGEDNVVNNRLPEHFMITLSDKVVFQDTTKGCNNGSNGVDLKAIHSADEVRKNTKIERQRLWNR